MRLRLTLMLFIVLRAHAQIIAPSAYQLRQWRMINPHRGGQTVGATGVMQQPAVFCIGIHIGGVWKTTACGRTWKAVYDEQPIGSVGDISEAPSNLNVNYAGSGEGLHLPDLSVGDGIYKSVDAGKSWNNTGLKHTQQIEGAIDPNDENRVLIAALGRPFGPTTERDIYRTLNRCKTWERVYKDEHTGAKQVTIDPKNTNILHTDQYTARQGPESGLYKSTDGGTAWTKLTKGLPTLADGLRRISGSAINSLHSQHFKAGLEKISL